MKKLTGILLLSGSVLSLSACGGIPTCYDELDECGRDTAYTEERTVKANRTPAPAPAPEPVVIIETPAPAPAPAPVVIDDTPVMRSAEPMVEHISK